MHLGLSVLLTGVTPATPVLLEQNQALAKCFAHHPSAIQTVEHTREQHPFLCLTGTAGDVVTDALRTPLGISLSISPDRARFVCRVKAGSEHLPDNSTAEGSSPCLPEPGGKFPTDFRGWN